MSGQSQVSVTCARVDDERELFARYLAADERAFAEIHRRFAPKLRRYALSRTRCPQTADDLVQQTFLNAHLARERFDQRAALQPWLKRILVNLLRDHFRREKRRQPTDIDVELVAAPETPLPIEQRESVDLTRRALATLREPQRLVVHLHWIEGRPFSEVANELGVNTVTAKVRAYRAYKQLRTVLAATG